MSKNTVNKKDEGFTVKEVIAYRRKFKLQTHTYGKYGTLAKIYLEEHNPAKLWALAGDLPEYLHGIDNQAAEMYDAIYSKLSVSKEYAKTGEYMTDLQKEAEMQRLIDEEILNELVYIK